ncbi:MAG: hypothetical protein VW810_00280 [Pelagibacteraceae bacterium]
MAYNVFKRPMFKRGGPTQGTGIMSHVEPRVKAAMGFPSFGVSGQPSQQEIDAFKAANAKRIQDIRNQPSFFLGPRFTDPNFQSPFKNFFSTNTGFGFLDFGVPGDGSGITANLIKKQPPAGTVGKTGVEIGLEGEDGITDYDYTKDETINQVANIQAGIADLEKSGLYNTTYKDPNKKPTKEKPKYEESDIRVEVEKEAKMLKELLKNENYSKGELALIIAGALKEPGSIGDKLDKARELSLPVARERRKEDRAITLAAYKLAKEKEQQQIRAGKKPESLVGIEAIAESISRNPGEKRTKEQIKDDILKLKEPGASTRIESLNKIAPNILEAVKDIGNFKTELKEAESKNKVKDITRIRGDIERKLSLIRTVINYPEFDVVFPGVRQAVGLKEGGRVMKAIGGDVDEVQEQQDIITSKVSFGSGSETTPEPVQQLGYKELRDRLPPEITDDVINLISNNAEALQEFAYIRTQDDVNSFNVKYGVNLVIPPTRT